MISIAGQTLSAPTDEILDWVEQHLPQGDVWAFLSRAYPGWGLGATTLPTGYAPLPRPKLNSFYWPSGASRWACGLVLVHALELNGDGSDNFPGFHDAAFGQQGDQCNSVTLKMQTEDQTGEAAETLSCSVYCLPPIPLVRVLNQDEEPDNASYLLTVVDQRYFWWWTAAPDFGINETAGVTWSTAINRCASALGVTIKVDDINEAYLQPSRAINLTYEKIPPVLDAICANVGHVLRCKFDGTVETQAFETAKTARETDQEDNKDTRVVIAGGDRYADEF